MNKPTNAPTIPIQKHHRTSPQKPHHASAGRLPQHQIQNHIPQIQQQQQPQIQQQQPNAYNQVRFRTPQQRQFLNSPIQQQPQQAIIPIQQQQQQQNFNNRLYTPSPQKQFFQVRTNSLPYNQPSQQVIVQSPNISSHRQIGAQYQQIRQSQKDRLGQVNNSQQVVNQPSNSLRMVRPFYQQQQQQPQIVYSPPQVKQTVTQIVQTPPQNFSPQTKIVNVQGFYQNQQPFQQVQQVQQVVSQHHSISYNSRNSSGEKYVNINQHVSPVDEIQPSVNNSNQNSKHNSVQNAFIGNLRIKSESPQQNQQQSENPNKLHLFNDSHQNLSAIMPNSAKNQRLEKHVRGNSLESNSKQIEQYQDQLSIKRLPTNQSHHEFQDVGKHVDEVEVDKKVNYLLDEIDLIQQLLSSKILQNKEQREYIKKLEDENNGLKETLEKSKNEIQQHQLGSSMSSHISDQSLNQYAQKAEEYQNMIKSVLNQKTTMNDEVLGLKSENQKLYEKCDLLQGEIEAQKKAYEDRITILIQEIDTLNSQLQQKIGDEQHIQTLKKEVTMYQNKCGILQNTIQDLEIQISQNQSQNQELKQSVRQAEANSSKCQQLELSLKQTQELYQQKEKELKQQVYTLSEQNIQKQQSLDQLKTTQDRVKSFEEQMQSLDLEMNRLRETTRVQQQKMQADKQVIQELELKLQEMQQQSNQQSTQIITDNQILSKEIQDVHQMLAYEKKENEFKNMQLLENEKVIQELMEYRNKQINQVDSSALQEKDKQISYWKNKFMLLENVIKKYNDIDSLLKQRDL